MNSIHLLQLGQFMYSFRIGNLPPKFSAVAKGGAGGARVPPVFYLKSKTDQYKMLKIKCYQGTVWEVFKK